MNAVWSEPKFLHLAELVTCRTGLVFAPHRCGSFEQAVRKVMRDHSLGDLAEFEGWLASGQRPWHALIQQITVGETYFFREPQHFEYLRGHVLPELAALRGAAYRPRLWSAGCASGEEAYSLAIALQEEGKLQGAFVLGTDLSRAALARARAARYGKWSLRGIEPRLLASYFEQGSGDNRLSPELAKRVVFNELNLASSAYPSTLTGTFALDLILCRNVLIYLSPEAGQKVARRLYQCLSPGGYLITGPSDPLLDTAGFEILQLDHGIAYRRPPTTVEHEPSRARCAQLEWGARRTPAAASSRESSGFDRARSERAADCGQPAALVISGLRARCNSAPAQVVETECRMALLQHSLSPELHYLHALTLIGVSQSASATEALRRALYLDGSLAVAHYTLGSVLAKNGDWLGAQRAYRNAERCARAYPPDEPAPLADEISGSGLARAAALAASSLATRGIRP